MNDSRVTIFTNPTTISADGATNGNTISLLADYAGNDHIYGTSEYGLPCKFMVYGVVTGTGDGFTLSFKFQDSDDGSTWDDNIEFGVVTMDTSGYFVDDDGNARSSLTRVEVHGRLKTARAYGRVVVTAAGITGGETANVKGWLADGTNPRNDRKFR